MFKSAIAETFQIKKMAIHERYVFCPHMCYGFTLTQSNVIGQLKASTSHVKGLSLVAKLCLSQAGPLMPQSDHLLHSIGVDAHLVIKALRLTPDARSYMCCPKCFACYLQSSNTSYPAARTFKKTPSSVERGCQLCKSWTIRRIEHTTPVRHFIYHNFKEWLGEMLCRPGMEDLLDCMMYSLIRMESCMRSGMAWSCTNCWVQMERHSFAAMALRATVRPFK
jgi:hypothetical protein